MIVYSSLREKSKEGGQKKRKSYFSNKNINLIHARYKKSLTYIYNMRIVIDIYKNYISISI